MTSISLIIIGAGGHAKSVADAALSSGHSIAYFVSENTEEGDTLLDHPVHAAITKEENHTFVIAVGDNHTRKNIASELKQTYPNATFPAIIHPTAYVSPHALIDEGSVILAQANVGPNSTIGAFCIINSAASVDHDNHMGNFTSLAPASATGGNVTIGEQCAISMGAMLKHGVTIGAHCVIGANSYVHTACERNHIYYGTPAKKARRRREDEPYL